MSTTWTYFVETNSRHQQVDRKKPIMEKKSQTKAKKAATNLSSYEVLWLFEAKTWKVPSTTTITLATTSSQVRF